MQKTGDFFTPPGALGETMHTLEEVYERTDPIQSALHDQRTGLILRYRESEFYGAWHHYRVQRRHR